MVMMPTTDPSFLAGGGEMGERTRAMDFVANGGRSATWLFARSSRSASKGRQIGLAHCPFDITNFEVKEGRKANSATSGLARFSGS
jgi:hypothetical protein